MADTSDLLRQAVSFISGCFENEPMPQKIQSLVHGLTEIQASPLASRPAEVDDWISVDDRLPPQKRRCLISYESDADGEPCLDVGYGRLDNDGWKHAATFYSLAGASKGRPFEIRETATVKVLYWKEMPAAPSHTTNKEK